MSARATVNVLIAVYDGDGCREITGVVSGGGWINHLRRPDGQIRSCEYDAGTERSEEFMGARAWTYDEYGCGEIVFGPRVLTLPAPKIPADKDRRNYHFGVWVEENIVPIVDEELGGWL